MEHSGSNHRCCRHIQVFVKSLHVFSHHSLKGQLHLGRRYTLGDTKVCRILCYPRRKAGTFSDAQDIHGTGGFISVAYGHEVSGRHLNR